MQDAVNARPRHSKSKFLDALSLAKSSQEENMLTENINRAKIFAVSIFPSCQQAWADLHRVTRVEVSK